MRQCPNKDELAATDVFHGDALIFSGMMSSTGHVVDITH